VRVGECVGELRITGRLRRRASEWVYICAGRRRAEWTNSNRGRRGLGREKSRNTKHRLQKHGNASIASKENSYVTSLVIETQSVSYNAGYRPHKEQISIQSQPKPYPFKCKTQFINTIHLM
jgi:hypothetical protein